MKLSILIPVYKSEKYIRRCLDSILCQFDNHSDNCEIVIVDDGSPDKSGSICDDYACRWPNIRVFHKENEGTGKSRNFLMDKAIGDYIWFVDSDDTIQPHAVTTLLDILTDKADIDILTFCMQRFYSVGSYVEDKKPSYLGKKTGLEYMKSTDFDGFMCNKVYKLSFLRTHKIRFNETMICLEDNLFNLSADMVANNILVTDIVLYNYFQGNPNSTLQNKSLEASNRKIHDNFVSQDEIYKLCLRSKSQDMRSVLTRQLNLQVASFFYALYLTGRSVKDINNIIQEEKNRKLYPIGKTSNRKLNLYISIVNLKPLFLLVCFMHSIFKKKY